MLLCKFCHGPCNPTKTHYGDQDRHTFNCLTCKIDYVLHSNVMSYLLANADYVIKDNILTLQVYRIFSNTYSFIIMNLITKKTDIYFDPKLKSKDTMVIDQIFPDTKPKDIESLVTRIINLTAFL
jgi:hypothetical protein